MADYYPLIARAIAGLDPSAPGEARRALYERARSALIAQLRSVQPPLSESEITRERLSLEEAVRKVESEAAQRAREASRSGPRAGDAFRAGTPRTPKPGESAQPPARARPPVTPTPPQQRNLRPEQPNPNPSPNAPPQPPPSRPQPPQPAVGMQDPALPPTRERSGAPRRFDPNDRPPGAQPPNQSAPNQTQSPGVRGFRDIAADADDLGRAAAQANRAARKTYANVPSPTPEFDRLEPSMENRGADPDVPYSYDESAEEAARWSPPPEQPAPRPRPDKKADKKKAARSPLGGGGFPFKSAIAVGIVLILAGAAILWGPSLVSSVRNMLKPSVVEAPKDAGTAPRTKIPDRVGQPSSSEQVAPVAQRVVLYDEDPADPKGKQYVGTVVWRTEQIKGSGNAPGDLAVRADIDIPERKFKMTMSFRRNTDTSLPASHTAELTFILPQDFSGGGVGNVPGILMKSNEQARGTPLAGLAVKVTDGFFLVGLSNVESDRARNIQLLKERSWFDVPLVYANQRRAIIAIEKGAPGERAFADAFAAWGE
jgi:hypothetical protein